MTLRTKLDSIERYVRTAVSSVAYEDWTTVIVIRGADNGLPNYYAKNVVTGEVSVDYDLIRGIEQYHKEQNARGIYQKIDVVFGSDDDERAVRELMNTPGIILTKDRTNG
jgi:hypothetical protein